MWNGIAVLPGYVARIYQLRYFWMSLVRNDLVNRYRRSFLGILWSLVRPIGMTVVLCVVFSTLFNYSLREYAPFLFMGIAIWQFLVEAMVSGCTCYIAAAPYIRQQAVPLAIYPLRVVIGSGFHTGIALLMAVILTACFLGLPGPGMCLAVLPGLVLLFLLGFFLAMIFGLMHTHFPDTQHFLEIGLQVLIYLTPIMYKPAAFSSRRTLGRVIEYNPLTSMLDLIRRPLLDGEYPEPFSIFYAIAFVALVGVIAWVVLRKCEKTLVFWV